MDFNDYICNTIYTIFSNDEIINKLNNMEGSNVVLECSLSNKDEINLVLYKKENIKEFIKKLPKYKKVKKEDLFDNCSICLEEYKENTYKRTLECEHHFHKKCIDKWLKKCDEENIHCPICRKQHKITIEEIGRFNLQMN